MMLFWILAITDLIMVGITWAVYGSSATYRDGMLLGVHLPESAISLSPVAQLTDSYQKHIRKFYLLHLVLGVVVAIPFFWLASIGITLWCIWFCVFLARAVSLLYSAHRQLYLPDYLDRPLAVFSSVRLGLLEKRQPDLQCTYGDQCGNQRPGTPLLVPDVFLLQSV